MPPQVPGWRLIEKTKIETDFKVKSEEAGEELKARLQAVFDEQGMYPSTKSRPWFIVLPCQMHGGWHAAGRLLGRHASSQDLHLHTGTLSLCTALFLATPCEARGWESRGAAV